MITRRGVSSTGAACDGAACDGAARAGAACDGAARAGAACDGAARAGAARADAAGGGRTVRRYLRLTAALPLLAALVGGTSAVAGAPGHATCAAAATSSHAVLVVEHLDGSTLERCVPFDGGSVTGEQLLGASGLEYGLATYGSLGKAVCQIDNEPPQPSDCLGSGAYWSIDVRRGGGAWTSSDVGISSQTIGNGDALGFRYAAPSDQGPPPPPRVVCPAAAPTAPGSTVPAATATAPAGTAAVAVPAATMKGPATGLGRSSTVGSAGAPPSPPASRGTSPPGSSPGASATGAVAGAVATGRATRAGPGLAAAHTSAVAPDGPEWSLLVTLAGGGGLAGLVVVQLVVRRRTSPR